MAPLLRVAWSSVVFLSALASAQVQKPFEIEAELTVASKYVWRGINLVNDWVIQPGVTVSRGPISVGLWGNFEPTNWNLPNYTSTPRGRVTELDFTLEYTRTVGTAEWSLGIVDYQFPGTGEGRYQEWFATVELGDVWGSPYLNLYTGNNSYSGTYVTLGVTHALSSQLAGLLEVELNAELSYGDARSNNFYFGSSKAGFADLQLTASTSIGLGDRLNLAPALHYSTLFDRGLLAGQPRRTNLWMSVSLGFKF
ncbi:MAG: hypothetical protein IT363_13190 [Methanoregulaceae archaeon]|nr:hypothetical protein [Methanoregulaceae archaeon]